MSTKSKTKVKAKAKVAKSTKSELTIHDKEELSTPEEFEAWKISVREHNKAKDCYFCVQRAVMKNVYYVETKLGGGGMPQLSIVWSTASKEEEQDSSNTFIIQTQGRFALSQEIKKGDCVDIDFSSYPLLLSGSGSFTDRLERSLKARDYRPPAGFIKIADVTFRSSCKRDELINRKRTLQESKANDDRFDSDESEDSDGSKSNEPSIIKKIKTNEDPELQTENQLKLIVLREKERTKRYDLIADVFKAIAVALIGSVATYFAASSS